MKRVKRYLAKVVEPYNSQYLPLYSQIAANDNDAGQAPASNRL